MFYLLLDDIKRHHRTLVDVGSVVASCHHNSTGKSWHVLGTIPGMHRHTHTLKKYKIAFSWAKVCGRFKQFCLLTSTDVRTLQPAFGLKT